MRSPGIDLQFLTITSNIIKSIKSCLSRLYRLAKISRRGTELSEIINTYISSSLTITTPLIVRMPIITIFLMNKNG